MANHKSALKRHRQSIKRNLRNNMVRTRIKNVVKEVRSAVEANDTELAATALRKATSVLDKAATKKVIHARAAARRISRLSAAVNKMA
ncbi:30S ribosomal protein S20 [Maridesulfovibrio salexigens]|uniref:Small ribosomal subunit protein bS20 n=1 Tax=Maridesulfovibrio salexigens (strain ATCC 14822 / DSM 2638 / NCIMB 8403 / VKM B-1763) TaxID=526222 RepID=RS20_MARSD|nr:30S ribosomal protein S20 [Maridesulfovibrio salexigens]C6BV66.1 RecName: Full=Small ribosomal subunit protein bS20; AltName: Full=30S ribosomal protein S20 [Maridesulfovibrio salexigens DSM 2638]ACS80041.1 ribosomal protein S20 [Maridesulfovibrio salexigens DSM 2638]